MNIADKEFYALANEIKKLSEKEIYYRIRKSFELVPASTRKSCADFFNRFGYWGKLDEEKGIYEQIELKAKAFSEHIDDFVTVYETLCDYRSKRTFFSVLNNWYRYDFNTTSRTKEYLYDDYFDLDLVKCSDEEVFVDLGAYTGDTVLSYIKNYGEDCYKKIYCYEITPSVFEKLKKNLSKYKNIEFRLKGIGDGEKEMSFTPNTFSASANTVTENGTEKINVTTLDSDITERITLIKADIEGYEQKAIIGAKKHIRDDRPKLLFSVYHNNEDLWKIPHMIHEIRKDYKFYLRYKSSPIYPTEITLIAI